MRMSKAAAVGAAGLVLTLAACSSPETPAEETTAAAEETTEAPGTPEPTATGDDGPGDDDATAAPPAEETDEPADASFGTAPVTSAGWPGSGGDLLPVGVRVGTHQGYERVVFDLEGSDTPTYSVRYVDEAVQEGKGDVVDVEGNATLEVVITGFRYPEPSEADRLAQGSYGAEAAAEVDEVLVSGIFEGQNQAFIGLEEQVPFRVFTLTGPTRVVVDVQSTEG
ncbi:hypothetical protein [Georgenia sp. AZ-5]|uniref:AMIN-like domain-containing (lipo)protein n=1 Tax=Georgenia sp. AZ-5 TaxID=3367526 RepID=UPI0037545085